MEEDGAFSCDVPAATYDLGVTADGFTPFYRWAVKVEPARPADLGLLILSRGASVAGWIAVEEGAIDPSCVARLRPAVEGSSAIATRLRVQQATQEIGVRKDGFFQIAGVKPGIYSLEVEQPGWARAFLPAVEVTEGRESFVRDPLVLRRPLKLELHLSPVLDWLGQPWTVSVYPDSSRLGDPGARLLFEGPATRDGVVEVAGLAPQTVHLQVEDSRGNRVLQKRGVSLQQPADARIDLRIELLTVEGTLRLGRRAVGGTLWFGGRFGSPRFEIPVDEEGRFVGVLSRGGFWPVAVETRRPPIAAEIEVEVEPDRDGRTRLELHLPATKVFGQVVDEQGRPAPTASVDLSTSTGPSRPPLDDQGRFEAHGLSPGRVEVAASLSRGKTRWVATPSVIELAEGQEVGPLTIRLRPTRELAGTVLAEGLPVPGADVAVYAQSPPSAAGSGRWPTDLDGKFVAAIDPTAETLSIEVMAPGLAYQAFSVAATAQPTLRPSRLAGTVEIELPSPPSARKAEPSRFLLLQNGVLLRGLGQWMARQGTFPANEVERPLERWSLAEMAPGLYHACRIPLRDLPAWFASGGRPAARHCAEGTLAAGTTLKLRLPAEPDD